MECLLPRRKEILKMARPCAQQRGWVHTSLTLGSEAALCLCGPKHSVSPLPDNTLLKFLSSPLPLYLLPALDSFGLPVQHLPRNNIHHAHFCYTYLLRSVNIDTKHLIRSRYGYKNILN